MNFVLFELLASLRDPLRPRDVVHPREVEALTERQGDVLKVRLVRDTFWSFDRICQNEF